MPTRNRRKIVIDEYDLLCWQDEFRRAIPSREKLLTPLELGDHLRIDSATVRRLVRERGLPEIRFDDQTLRYYLPSVLEWAAKQTPPKDTETEEPPWREYTTDQLS